MLPTCFTLSLLRHVYTATLLKKKNTWAKSLPESFASVSVKAMTLTSALRSPRQASVTGLEETIRDLSVATQHGPSSLSYEGEKT